MRFDVVTLFPEMFDSLTVGGVVSRAIHAGVLSVRYRSPRQFGIGNHRSVDDTPYGGGAGMVMRPDCIVQCLESLDEDAPVDPKDGCTVNAYRVLLTPKGARLEQDTVRALASRPAVALVCGRYEGIDERVRPFVDEEISLGDFVLSGGELAAMAIIDACARFLPGVLGNPASLDEESHARCGQLEYPQYTRPVSYRGLRVPEVLLSGHHGLIASWRAEQASLSSRIGCGSHRRGSGANDNGGK